MVRPSPLGSSVARRVKTASRHRSSWWTVRSGIRTPCGWAGRTGIGLAGTGWLQLDGVEAGVLQQPPVPCFHGGDNGLRGVAGGHELLNRQGLHLLDLCVVLLVLAQE